MMKSRESKKKCNVDGCNNPLYFARGYCTYHYKTNYLAPKQALKPRKSYTIPRYTAKRKSQVTKYHLERKTFISEEIAFAGDRGICCIFCDEMIIKSEPDIHHGLGRDNEMLLDTVFWFLVHNKCHVHQFHSMSCKDIPWWPNYLFRMQYINPKVYKKDLLRQSKS